MYKSERLYFLDWLRIIAFLILIAFHTSKYYAALPWHIQSPYANRDIIPYMMLTGPWRLALLFMIAGVASAFILGRTSPLRFFYQRSYRLLIPLVFGIIAIIPPQIEIEVMDKFAYRGTFTDFMALYLSGYGGFCTSNGKCLFLPDWNHLWFLAYLWVFSLALAIFASHLGNRMAAYGARLAVLLAGWRMIVLPACLFVLLRIALTATAISGLPFVVSLAYQANYFVLFVAGVLLARQAAFWNSTEAQRWIALAISLACWAARVTVFLFPQDATSPGLATTLWNIEQALFGICSWTGIVAACGFAHRHLNFDSAIRRYMTQAVFPVYILHQTVIIGLAFNMRPLELPPLVEGPAIALLTALLCFAAYEVIRRLRYLHPLFGLNVAAPPARQDTVIGTLAPVPAKNTNAA